MFNLQVLMYDNEDLTINRAASVVKKPRANFMVMIDWNDVFFISKSVSCRLHQYIVLPSILMRNI